MTPEHKQELSPFLSSYQFPGQGQSTQPVITCPGAIKLVMWLPGKHAKSTRTVTAEIITRYVTGDLSLIPEIKKHNLIGPSQPCAGLLSKAISKRKHTELTQMPMSGWVYCTQSDAFPGLVKIGRTLDLSNRLMSGNTFCAPSPHVVVAAVPSFDPKRDEFTTHVHFARHRQAGEFFQVSREEVQAYFNLEIMPVYQQELLCMITGLQEGF